MAQHDPYLKGYRFGCWAGSFVYKTRASVQLFLEADRRKYLRGVLDGFKSVAFRSLP